MNKKDDLQKKVIEFQILDTNLKMLQERAEIINQKLEEFYRSKEAMEGLKNTKPNKTLIPLGSGNFIFGSIENCEDVIVEAGGGVAIKKNREDAIKILEGKIKELENSLGEIIKQSSAFVLQIEKVQQEIEDIQK